jgi:hypothetical protein
VNACVSISRAGRTTELQPNAWGTCRNAGYRMKASSENLDKRMAFLVWHPLCNCW